MYYALFPGIWYYNFINSCWAKLTPPYRIHIKPLTLEHFLRWRSYCEYWNTSTKLRHCITKHSRFLLHRRNKQSLRKFLLPAKCKICFKKFSQPNELASYDRLVGLLRGETILSVLPSTIFSSLFFLPCGTIGKDAQSLIPHKFSPRLIQKYPSIPHEVDQEFRTI